MGLPGTVWIAPNSILVVQLFCRFLRLYLVLVILNYLAAEERTTCCDGIMVVKLELLDQSILFMLKKVAAAKELCAAL